MKKNNKNKIFKYIFISFFLSFLVVYFSELTGYYEYQNHQKKVLTEEQIKQFETDIVNGKEVDINNYLVVDTSNYNNNLSKITSRLSDCISTLVQNGIEGAFKFLSKLVTE